MEPETFLEIVGLIKNTGYILTCLNQAIKGVGELVITHQNQRAARRSKRRHRKGRGRHSL